MYDKETLKKAQEGVSYVLERAKIPVTSDHAELRMEERGIMEDDIKAVLLYGCVVEGHEPLSYPRGPQPHQNQDPVFTFHLSIDDRTLCVAVAVKRDGRHARVFIITVYWK